MEYPHILTLDLNDSNFEVRKGRAKNILPEEIEKDYYKWVNTGSTFYDIALEERILKPIENGLLIVRRPDGSIKFDDRKLRFDSYLERNGHYELFVAPTHFGEMKRALRINSVIF